MTLLDTIKSLLGLGGSQGSGNGREGYGESTSRAEVETGSEDAVKGTDEPAATGGDAAGSTESMVDEQAEGGAEPGEITGPASGGDVDSTETATPDGRDGDNEESAAAGGDAAGSTGSMTDADGSDTAAEPGEATGPASGEADLDPDHDEAGSADETAAAGGDAAGSTGSITEETNDSVSATEDAEAVGPTGEEPTDAGDTAVDALKGIGPSYADQLAEAGIETVEDLAAVDTTALAADTDIAQSRIERWVERAKARQQ